MEIIFAVDLMSLISYIYRSVKLPAVTKALEKKKPKSSTTASPLHEDPMTTNDDENVEEGKPVIVKNTAKLTSSKELSINLEVMTLKPAVKTEPKRQTARRGKKFQYGCVTRQVTPAAVGGGGGEVRSVYNEVAAAHGLVGLSDEQPKSGYIRNLRKRPGDIIIEQPENEVNIIDLHDEGSENVNQKQQAIQQEIPPKRQKMEAAETKQVLQESPKEGTTKVQVSDLIELSQIEQDSEERIGTLKNILSMLESKEEMEKSLEDIHKIDAGNCVESQDVSSSVCIKNPETVNEPEEVDKVEAKSDSGDTGGAEKQDNIPKSIDVPENEKSMDAKSAIDGAEKPDNLSISVDEPEEVDKEEAESDSGNIGGAKKQDNIPKSIDVPENEKSMDSKSDIDGAEKQDNLSVSVDEPEKVQQVEAESDIGADKTECVIHDRTPEGEVSCEDIGYIKSGDSNIITLDVKEKPPESITYKLPLSVEEREEGRPPDGHSSGKKVSCSDTVDTAEINVSTDLDDTVEINDLVIDENRDVSIPSDSGKVPRIVGGDVPIGDCDGFYDLDSTPPCL